MRKTALAALLAAASLPAAGCSGHASANSRNDVSPAPVAMTSSPAPSPVFSTAAPSADSTAALRAAVQRYSDAYLTGTTSTAWGILSARCQAKIGRDSFDAETGDAKSVYGSALPFVSFDAQVAGSMARVTYTYSVSAIDQTGQPWSLEHGSWHYDGC